MSEQFRIKCGPDEEVAGGRYLKAANVLASGNPLQRITLLLLYILPWRQLLLLIGMILMTLI